MKFLIILCMAVGVGTALVLPAAQAAGQGSVRKEYYDSGALKSEMEYRNGKRHGTGKIYTPEGDVAHIVEYNDGKLVHAYSPAPERNLGLLNFLKSIWFWVGIVVMGTLLWLGFSKIFFSKKPF